MVRKDSMRLQEQEDENRSVNVIVPQEEPDSEPSPASSMPSPSKSRPLFSLIIASVLVIAFLALSYLICGRPKYETNDDVVMSMLSTGIGFVDKPNEHLLYTNYLIGQILVWLNEHSRSLAWYSTYLFVSECIAMVTMAYIFLRKSDKRSALLVLPIFFLAVCLRPTQLMQFTTTAALVAAAGALCLFDTLQKNPDWRRAWKPLAYSLALFCLSAAIRVKSARAIIILAVLYVICLAFTRIDMSRLKIYLACLTLAMGLSFVMEKQNSNYYVRTGWGEFYDINYPRFHLTEFGRTNILTPKIVSAFKSVNWSPVDNYMLSRFYLLDENIFSLDKLRKLDAAVPEIKEINFKELASNLLSILRKKSIFPMLIAIGLLTVLIDKSRFSNLSKVLYLTGLLGATMYLQITMKLPIYVFSGMLGFIAVTLLWMLASTENIKIFSGGVLRRAALIGIAAALLLAFCLEIDDYRKMTARTAELNNELLTCFGKNSDKNLLYVMWAYALPFDAIRPFDRLNDYFGDTKILGINFLGRTDANVSRLKEFGIKDLMNEFDKQSIRLVSNDEFNQKIADYIAQHYNRVARFTEIRKAPIGEYTIYKVSLLDKTTPAPNLDRQWNDYLALVAGFIPRSGGSIIIADELGCHANQGKLDLVLYPSASNIWTYTEMRPAKERAALPFFSPAKIPPCPICNIDPKNTSSFESTGKLPTMSHSGALRIEPAQFSRFYVEIAAPENMVSNRAVLVEFNLPMSKSWKFLIPLQIDSAMHRYEFDLAKLRLGSQEIISEINVHPVYLRDANNKSHFRVGRMGFVHKSQSESPPAE